MSEINTTLDGGVLMLKLCGLFGNGFGLAAVLCGINPEGGAGNG